VRIRSRHLRVPVPGPRLHGGRLSVKISHDRWLHIAAACVSCVLLPAYSHAAGTGALAWVMFSQSDAFRLSVHAFDRQDVEHVLHPIQLVQQVDPALRAYLSVADRFATWPIGSTLEARFMELAHNGCRAGPYARVELTLERRATLGAPVHTIHDRALCP